MYNIEHDLRNLIDNRSTKFGKSYMADMAEQIHVIKNIYANVTLIYVLILQICINITQFIIKFPVNNQLPN